MKRSVAFSLFLIFVLIPAFAFAVTLEDFKTGATVEAIGTCDQGRTSLVSFDGDLYIYMMRISPAPGKFYYIVKRISGARFFAETFIESGRPPQVLEISTIEEFGNIMAGESPDFHKVLQKLPNGCGLQKVSK